MKPKLKKAGNVTLEEVLEIVGRVEKMDNKKAFIDKKIEEFEKKFLKVYPDGSKRFLRGIEPDDFGDFLSSSLSEGWEIAERDGRNEYFFDSPEYLASEAHGIACTINQRVNQDTTGLSKTERLKEVEKLSNKLVSITKRLLNEKTNP